MTPNPRRVLVLCSQPGRLLNYSVLLNRLNYFHLSLCQNLDEVRKVLAKKNPYSLFIYDDFIPGVGEMAPLRRLSENHQIGQFLLVGSFNEHDKTRLFRWACSSSVPLLQVLDKPFNLAQLREAIGDPECAEDCNGCKCSHQDQHDPVEPAALCS
ncbi:hypothetical protein D3C76_393360 [compost metagenome]